jgi:hypothetical protein
MTSKLSLEEALSKLARSRHAAVERARSVRSKVRSAHRTNANEEFSEPPSADLALCVVGILIALTLIDWFAVRWS